jgi:hypothetical protein
MLKYRNTENNTKANIECENEDPKKFDMAKCNKKLFENLIDNKSLTDEVAANTNNILKLSMEIAFGKIAATAPITVASAATAATAATAAKTAESIKEKQKQVENLQNTNASLVQQIANNTEFLYRKRCIFMTFKEYSVEKVHINNNMFCHHFPSINETLFKSTIKAKLLEVQSKLQPASLKKIPLPIYVMLAKKLEEHMKDIVFKGNYEVFLYIPNLYNYQKDETNYKIENAKYTLFPSLDAFSKQNRWMELMTSKHSKYLDVVKIGLLKDNENKIKKQNFFKNDLTNTCLNMGCVASDKDPVRIPTYSTSTSELDTNVDGVSPYLPSRCLKTPYYNIQMMNLNAKDEKRFRGSANVLEDNFDIDTHCNAENIKKYEAEKEKDNETFDLFLCEQIKKCKKYDGKDDPKYDNDDDRRICDKPKHERIPDLMSHFFIKNFKAGTDDNQYSKDYNNNILKELAFRKSKYPGLGDDIQEIVFSMFVINEKLFEENMFCYMPWGNMLLKQDYVINEQETLEIDRVSFKSFNDVFEMKFHNDGYLYIFQNNNIKFMVSNQSKNLSCFKRRVLRFENMLLNIYGYDEHNNYDLRGSVGLNNKSMYVSPASLILSNETGELILYDLGINNKSA